MTDFGKLSREGDKIYLPFQKSIEFIKKFYAQDPHNPQKPVAQALFQTLFKKLNLKDAKELSFYSAIDTPLDTFHGIDGFFECENVQITIDLTANPKKEDSEDNVNVDIVLHELPDPSKEPSDFKKELDDYTNDMVKMFSSKKRTISLNK